MKAKFMTIAFAGLVLCACSNGEKNTVEKMVVIKVAEDTYIYEFKKDRNYGKGIGPQVSTPGYKSYYEATMKGPKIRVGFQGKDREIGLLKFDVSSIEDPMKVKRAVLRLNNDLASSSLPCKIAARLVLSPWNEMEVTWNTMPVIDSNDICVITLVGEVNWQNKEGIWYEWDITDAVKKWVENPLLNFGIALVPLGTSGVDRDFVAKEFDLKKDKIPELVVYLRE